MCPENNSSTCKPVKSDGNPKFSERIFCFSAVGLGRRGGGVSGFPNTILCGLSVI